MSTKDLKFYKELEYRIIIEKQELETEIWFIAYTNELGKFACYGRGENQSEALESFINEKNDFIEYLYNQGKEIPEPKNVEENIKFSGIFNVRTSPTIHSNLVYQAKEQDISLNLYLNQILSAVAEKKCFDTIVLDKLAELSGKLEAHHFEVTKQLRYQKNSLIEKKGWADEYCDEKYLKIA